MVGTAIHNQATDALQYRDLVKQWGLWREIVRLLLQDSTQLAERADVDPRTSGLRVQMNQR
jgi:hypothetical protein